ncbi:hypothetical protein, partial [Rathayibacter tritici]|uniref:hypothetical protein n=1 Tax=Rathayibacter tritici TaxID=33888 RepID=UPI001CA48DA6
LVCLERHERRDDEDDSAALGSGDLVHRGLAAARRRAVNALPTALRRAGLDASDREEPLWPTAP